MPGGRKPVSNQSQLNLDQPVRIYKYLQTDCKHQSVCTDEHNSSLMSCQVVFMYKSKVLSVILEIN